MNDSTPSSSPRMPGLDEDFAEAPDAPPKGPLDNARVAVALLREEVARQIDKPRLALYRLSNQFWDLVWIFFELARCYRGIHAGYETLVKAYSEHFGIDRRHLRLNAKQVAELFDFRVLDRLCLEEVQALQHIARSIFRGTRSTDAFDLYASQLFKELHALRDEQFKVGTLAHEYEVVNEPEASQAIINEVHYAFPRYVRGVYDLVEKCRERLEELLPSFRRDRVFLRSVYLFGDEVFFPIYPDGRLDALALLYPSEGGACRGLLEVARSFSFAGFVDPAMEALALARDPDVVAANIDEDDPLAASLLTEIDALYASLKARGKRKGGARARLDGAKSRREDAA